MHEWGDYHPRFEQQCNSGGTNCSTWRQPYESYYIEFLRADGSVVGRTPDTGDIPDRFPAGDPNVIQNPNGTTGSEAKRLYHNFTVPSGAPITAIRVVHSYNSTQTGGNQSSVHLFGYRFTVN